MTYLQAQYLASEDPADGTEKQLGQARQGILANSLAVVSDLRQQLLQNTARRSEKIRAWIVQLMTCIRHRGNRAHCGMGSLTLMVRFLSVTGIPLRSSLNALCPGKLIDCALKFVSVALFACGSFFPTLSLARLKSMPTPGFFLRFFGIVFCPS